jgi:iron complex outermembrane recepter protein
VEPYPGSGAYDCAGYYGDTCGNPLPKWRHVFSDTWATPLQGFDVMARWRHLNSVVLDSANPSPLLAGASGPVNPAYSTIGSRDYLDLMFMYQWTKGVTVRLGANNVLDKDPPVLPAGEAISSVFFNGNTYPQIYDTLGRYVFLNLTLDF